MHTSSMHTSSLRTSWKVLPLVLGVASLALGQSQSTAPQSQTTTQQTQTTAPATQSQGRSPGGDIDSGHLTLGDKTHAIANAGLIEVLAGTLTLKGKVTGKGAADVVTLHPLNGAGEAGKGAAVGGKDVGVGAAKGTGKIAKGTGKGIKKIF